MKVQNRLAGVIGNIFDHYDTALFSLLPPFIAPLFFDASDPLLALILTYGMLPLGFLSRPLGSFAFGRLADMYGRRRSLFISLFGMGGATVAIGFLPTYSQIGLAAPISLALLRVLQGFFAAGEGATGAVFLLEQTTKSKRGFAGGLYDASSIGGFLLASLLVGYLSGGGGVENHWRWLFWGGGVAAAMGLWIRGKGSASSSLPQGEAPSLWSLLAQQKKALLSLSAASGFSYTTYYLPLSFLNGYLPVVSTQSAAEASLATPWLLLFDLVFLFFFGWLSDVWGRAKIMMGAALAAAILGVPLFLLLSGGSPEVILAVRFCIVGLGAAFAAPFYAQAFESLPAISRCTLLSLSQSIGSQWIGAPSAACSFWMYRTWGWEAAPGFYLSLTGLFAFWGILALKQQKSVVGSLSIRS